MSCIHIPEEPRDEGPSPCGGLGSYWPSSMASLDPTLQRNIEVCVGGGVSLWWQVVELSSALSFPGCEATDMADKA